MQEDGFDLGPGRPPGRGSGSPLQCPCLNNPTDKSLGACSTWRSQRVRHDWMTKNACGFSKVLLIFHRRIFFIEERHWKYVYLKYILQFYNRYFQMVKYIHWWIQHTSTCRQRWKTIWMKCKVRCQTHMYFIFYFHMKIDFKQNPKITLKVCCFFSNYRYTSL